ncbi:GNAT family N-acetyltransferase [Actinopolyspora mortivallis]|uniref:GNAT family N-acetyltransferase n=1 Tax=Actinopolyspora mortivallis TaxID=33906 RepID=UPI0003A5A24E|nr:GNAT family N-acetyltransferase [Actinopolyspora mortivallis]
MSDSEFVPREHAARRFRPTSLVGIGVLVVLLGVAHRALAYWDAGGVFTPALVSVGGVLLLLGVCRTAVRHTGENSSPRAGGTRPAESSTVASALTPSRQLWRVRASVDDTPGALAAVASELSRLDADIRTVRVHPVADAAVDEFLLDLPVATTHSELVAAVAGAGAGGVTAERTDPRELDDMPTRALRLANELVTGTVEPERALRALLGEVTSRSARHPGEAGIEGVEGTVMRLTDPDGGLLTVRRPHGEFTPAEFARAGALLTLVSTRRRLLGRPVRSLRTKHGRPVLLRTADTCDLDLVRALHGWCSGAGMHRRYFGAGTPTERGLRLLLTPELGRSLLAFSVTGEVIGMGNLGYTADEGELALLVRDDWQGHGVGSVLRDALLEHARQRGLDTVTALTQLDNTPITRTLRSAGFRHAGTDEPGEWSWVFEPGREPAGCPDAEPYPSPLVGSD